MPRPIGTVEEFYAHALAIEHEAAERYTEFATWFGDRGDEVLAGLCHNLARFEGEHYKQLVHGCHGLALPNINAADYLWLGEAPPETGARELFLRAAQPRHILEIALEAEMRARDFFAWVARTSSSHAVRELAAIMAAEEAEHVAWVTQAMEYHPDHRDWESLFEATTASAHGEK
jgi:rubrerythrin